MITWVDYPLRVEQRRNSTVQRCAADRFSPVLEHDLARGRRTSRRNRRGEGYRLPEVDGFGLEVSVVVLA